MPHLLKFSTSPNHIFILFFRAARGYTQSLLLDFFISFFFQRNPYQKPKPLLLSSPPSFARSNSKSFSIFFSYSFLATETPTKIPNYNFFLLFRALRGHTQRPNNIFLLFLKLHKQNTRSLFYRRRRKSNIGVTCTA